MSEPNTMNAGLNRIRQHNLPVRTVLDVGASNGKWSRDLLSLYPDASYLLFEPLEEQRPTLAQFRVDHPNADFEITAVGDRLGHIEMIVPDDLDGSRAVHDEPSPANARKVPMTTLDDAVERRALPGPFLIKLDVHGFELPILSGARNILVHTSILIVEVYNFRITPASPLFFDLAARLDSLGFRCFDLVDLFPLHPGGLAWQMDLFFAPKSSPAFQQLEFKI